MPCMRHNSSYGKIFPLVFCDYIYIYITIIKFLSTRFSRGFCSQLYELMLSHFWWVLCLLTIWLVSPLENYGPHIEVCSNILLVCYIYRYNCGVTRAGAAATQSRAQSCLLHACSCKLYVNVSIFLRHFSNGSVIFSSFDPFLGHPSTLN